MDYEKKYKNALEWARQVMNGEIGFIRKDVEKVFPELKESEDAQIRKALIDYFRWNPNSQLLNEFSNREVFAYLEKQGNLMKALQISNSRIAELVEEKYNLEKKLEKQGEQKPNYCHHEVDLSGCSEEYRKGYYDGWNNCNQQHAQLKAEQKPAWGEEDEIKIKSIVAFLKSPSLCAMDGNKGIIDENIKYLKSLKDRVRPKQEWSEEDEKMRAAVLQLITDSEKENGWNCVYCNDKEIYFSDIIAWFKSLKEKYTWLPSDEQMAALSDMNCTGCISYAGQGQELINLYNDLKKLRKE